MYYIYDKELVLFATNDLIASSKGTPYFQPPEIHNENIEYFSGSKVDIWSSGCILFNMITGKLAFQAESVGGVLDNILNKDVEYPKEILKEKTLLDLLNSN